VSRYGVTPGLNVTAWSPAAAVIGTVAGCNAGDPKLAGGAVRDRVERICSGARGDRRRRDDRADDVAVVEERALSGRGRGGHDHSERDRAEGSEQSEPASHEASFEIDGSDELEARRRF